MKTKTRSHRVLIMILITAGLAFLTVPASGQIVRVFTVNTTSDTVIPNACSTGATGCSLRGAITASNPNGDALIQFNIPSSDPFCSAGACTISINTLLPVISGPNTTILGPGASRLTVKPSTGVVIPVFDVVNSSGTVVISGLTITDGRASQFSGGGINKQGTARLDIVDVLLRNSSGAGAIRVGSGTVLILRSTIEFNQVGVNVLPGAFCNIANSTIALNSSSSTGGGIFNSGNTVITNSTIALNSASISGGGVQNNGNAIDLKSSIIAGNSAGGAPDVSGNFDTAGFNLIGKVDGSTGVTAPTDLTGTIASPLNPRLDLAGPLNRGGPTPTIALLPNSPATDKGSSSGLTGALTTDQRSGAFSRTRDNPLVGNAAGGNGTDIGAYERNTSSTFDFDGDVKTDIGIFRPSDGTWWINRSSNGATFAVQFGASTDRIVPADYTGDGKTDIAFWRPANGNWFILRSEDFSFFSVPFGTNGDVPAPADFDNDGRADVAVFRPSNATWFIQRSTGGTAIQQFGANGDVPVAADYDGDGRSDIAIYRPSNGQWWLNRSTGAGVIAMTFGTSTDKPVPGDFTGDGKTDVAIWRPSTGEWFVLRSENSTFFSFPFGSNGDLPSPGDYDGDGRVDATVFRPSNATWFVQRSASGTTIQQFGVTGDKPVANAFVP